MPDVISLELHHVSMGGGDCTAILVRWSENANDNNAPVQVAKVLVDAGGEVTAFGQKTVAAYLAKVIDVAKPGPWDLVIASHYHADHIAGFQRCGIDFLRLVDIGGYPVGNDTWQPVNPLGNLAEDSDMLKSYGVHVTEVFARGGRARVELPFIKAANFNTKGDLTQGAGPVKIEMPGLPVTLTIYAAGGVLADGTNVLRDNVRRRVLRKNKLDEFEPGLSDQSMNQVEDDVDVAFAKVSPNDSSIAFVLQWGDFRYFSAGDLSGDLSLTRYANLEEPLMAYLDSLGVLARPVDVMKATHHGSNHNNYPSEVYRKADWSLSAAREDDDQGPDPTTGLVRFASQEGSGLLDELKPETIIVPCNQMKCVPGGEYVSRVRAYCLAGQYDRIVTVNFINQCTYAHPDYRDPKDRQKAKWEDFDALRNAVDDTELEDGAGDLNNGFPQVAVVTVPPLPLDTVTADGTTLFWKDSHSLKLDYNLLDKSDASLTRKSTGEQLKELSADIVQALNADLGNRAQEIVDLSDPASDPAYVRRRYPALVDESGKALRYAGKAEVLSALTSLVSTCYPTPAKGLVYTPDNARTSSYQRTTAASLLRNTPDQRVLPPQRSINGVTPLDAEMLGYWKSKDQYKTGGTGAMSYQLRPGKKQKTTDG